MSRKRVHWHPPGFAQPRARCGAWRGSARLARDTDKVTCKHCLSYVAQAKLDITPIRGRPIHIELKSGDIIEGPLIAGGPSGLTVCSRTDGQLKHAPWPHIAQGYYLDADQPNARSA